jgi:hypothetical protein
MKKLTLALSALAAVFGAASAKADVSVSGSGSAAYIVPAGTSADNEVAVGQFVSFGLSTTTASGMTITGGMGLSQSVTADAAPAVSGGQSLTFASGGSSLKIGDVEAADTPGSVGGLVGDQIDDNGDLNSNVASGFNDDDGLGVSFTTAVGSTTLNITHVGNTGANSYGTLSADGNTSVTSIGFTMPMGAYTVSAGFATADGTTESAAGASVSGAIGGGNLTVGYSQQTLDASARASAATYKLDTSKTSATAVEDAAASTGDLSADGDTTVLGAVYAMSLDADTSMAFGYQSVKDGDNDSHQQFDATVSRALGGGASVFVELRNLTGDAAVKGSAIAVGSRVSF